MRTVCITDSRTSRDDFLTATRTRPADQYPHSGPAAHFCGLRHAKYDIYVDIERLSEGMAQVARAAPHVPVNLLTSGWQNCTLSGSNSLLEGGSATGHANVHDGESAAAKAARMDAMFCNESVAVAVAHHYAADYGIMRKSGAFPGGFRCDPHHKRGPMSLLSAHAQVSKS